VYSNEDKIVEIVTETTTESMVSASLAQPLTILNCTAAQTEFNGQCVNVFTRHLCPSSTQWLVEDPITLKGKCVENPCHKEPSKAFFGGKCVVAYAEKNEVCHPGMTTYLFKYEFRIYHLLLHWLNSHEYYFNLNLIVNDLTFQIWNCDL